jgi:Rrf2 family protein
MKITSLEEYGLRCLIQVARGGDGPTPISEIAVKEGLSIEYVGKLLAELRRGGLVTSFRGKAGGYTLAIPATEITLRRIIETLSEPLFDTGSFCDRFPGNETDCVHLGACSVRPIWSLLADFLTAALDSVTLADLAGDQCAAETRLRESLIEQAKLMRANELNRLPTIP